MRGKGILFWGRTSGRWGGKGKMGLFYGVLTRPQCKGGPVRKRERAPLRMGPENLGAHDSAIEHARKTSFGAIEGHCDPSTHLRVTLWVAPQEGKKSFVSRGDRVSGSMQTSSGAWREGGSPGRGPQPLEDGSVKKAPPSEAS